MSYFNIFSIKRYISGKALFFILFIFLIQNGIGQNKDTVSVQKEVLTQLSVEDETAKAVNTLALSDTVQSAKSKRESFSPPELSDVISVSNIVWTIITLIIGYLFINLILNLLTNIARRNKKREFAIKRMIPIIRILSWTFVIYLIIVGIYSPPAATIFAFLASVGVAVGFASQDLLKNVFGGLVVMFDRPFQIGDKIESGKYYGEVIEIGIRSTKVVSPDDSVITIPNSEFMMQYVANSNSGENNCQVVAEIYLPIDIDTDKVRQIATEAALVSKFIFLNKPVVVLFFNEFKDRNSVLKMRLKAYVSSLDKEFAFKSEMTELVIRELINEGIIKKDFYSK